MSGTSAARRSCITRRGLYLILFDARHGEEAGRLEYWLKLVESFSDDSPVIVVINKIDQDPAFRLDERGLMQKYKCIRAFVKTSCSDKTGLDALQTRIETEILALPHIADPLAASWFAVKERLEAMERDFIAWSEYQDLCRERGVARESEQNTLLGYLHDLGIVLCFADDPRLHDTNVLNPRWVTEGIYSLLNNYDLNQNKGVLPADDIGKYLDPARYPATRRMFIIDMMRKFELCYESDDDRAFFIPELYPKEEPDTDTFDDALRFEFHYGVLPRSVISRFIVRNHTLIVKKTYWRAGVVIANAAGKYNDARHNKALVKADLEEKRIFVSVKGNRNTRREFLGIIRNEFRHIHGAIAQLDVQEKVPLPDNRAVTVSYDHLLTLENEGIDSFIPDGAAKTYSVKKLLADIESEATTRSQLDARRKDGLRDKGARRDKDDDRSRYERRGMAGQDDEGAAGQDDEGARRDEDDERLRYERRGRLSEQLDKIENELRPLRAQKEELDRKATWRARLKLGVIGLGFAALGVIAYFVIKKFEWNVVEPWTFIVAGCLAPAFVYGYYAITNRAFSPEAIRAHEFDKARRRLYREHKFDAANFEELESQARALALEMRALET